MTSYDKREQIAFKYPQQPPYVEQQYARQLPRVRIKTRQEIEAEARRQAALEAVADHSYTGHQAGLHPENRPYLSEELTHSKTGRSASTLTPVTFDAEGEYDLEEDESYYTTRLPTSSRRYHVSPEEVYQQGNTRLHVRYVDVPPRSSQQKRLPPQRKIHIDDDERAPQRGSVPPGRRYHPLVWTGAFLTLLILGWIGLNVVTAWFQSVQNDWTYGQKRHFDIDAVVGHSDSPANPSHFTAENRNGQIIVIELPGGNVSKAKIYQIETIPNNIDNPPVRLSFQDMNGDGRPDMLVQIGDGSATLYVTLWNNGTEFVSKL